MAESKDWILNDPEWAKVVQAWRNLEEGSDGLNAELAINAILAGVEFAGHDYAESVCGEHCGPGHVDCAVKDFEEILDALRRLGSES